MALETASYIAQIIVGVSVIVSLLFVALELRHNAAAARATINQSLFEQLSAWHQTLIADPTILEAMIEADNHPEQVHGAARARMRLIHGEILQHWASFWPMELSRFGTIR